METLNPLELCIQDNLEYCEVWHRISNSVPVEMEVIFQKAAFKNIIRCRIGHLLQI